MQSDDPILLWRKMQSPIRITIIHQRLGICRMDPKAELPDWAAGEPFFSITRTADELSIICPERNIPPGVVRDYGWRAMKLEGPFEFTMIGVLAGIAVPLAHADISILAVATYDTDYVLVKQNRLEQAVDVLSGQGYQVRYEDLLNQ